MKGASQWKKKNVIVVIIMIVAIAEGMIADVHTVGVVTLAKTV